MVVFPVKSHDGGVTSFSEETRNLPLYLHGLRRIRLHLHFWHILRHHDSHFYVDTPTAQVCYKWHTHRYKPYYLVPQLPFINGSIVFRFTLTSIRITTSPQRCIIPKTGGFSFSKVPPFRAILSVDFYGHLDPFRQRLWDCPCVCNDIDFITLHFVLKRYGLAFFSTPSRSWVVIC